MKSVLHSFGYTLEYLREQVADVEGDRLVAQPAGQSNHPAWVIGHLTFTCEMLGGAVGVAPWLPPHFRERYGTGSVPIADASRYESKAEALAMLRDAAERLVRAVEGLDDDRLNQLFPDPSLHEVFPTIRHALTQVLVGHAAFHVGQVSVWRKAMGLPALGRSYE